MELEWKLEAKKDLCRTIYMQNTVSLEWIKIRKTKKVNAVFRALPGVFDGCLRSWKPMRNREQKLLTNLSLKSGGDHYFVGETDARVKQLLVSSHATGGFKGQ